MAPRLKASHRRRDQGDPWNHSWLPVAWAAGEAEGVRLCGDTFPAVCAVLRSGRPFWCDCNTLGDCAGLGTLPAGRTPKTIEIGADALRGLASLPPINRPRGVAQAWACCRRREVGVRRTKGGSRVAAGGGVWRNDGRT